MFAKFKAKCKETADKLDAKALEWNAELKEKSKSVEAKVKNFEDEREEKERLEAEAKANAGGEERGPMAMMKQTSKKVRKSIVNTLAPPPAPKDDGYGVTIQELEADPVEDVRWLAFDRCAVVAPIRSVCAADAYEPARSQPHSTHGGAHSERASAVERIIRASIHTCMYMSVLGGITHVYTQDDTADLAWTKADWELSPFQIKIAAYEALLLALNLLDEDQEPCTEELVDGLMGAVRPVRTDVLQNIITNTLQ